MLWVAKLSSFLGGGKKQTKASNGARFIHLDLFESMREFTKNVEHGCVSYSKYLVVQNGMIYKWIKWYIKHICIYINIFGSFNLLLSNFFASSSTQAWSGKVHSCWSTLQTPFMEEVDRCSVRKHTLASRGSSKPKHSLQMLYPSAGAGGGGGKRFPPAIGVSLWGPSVTCFFAASEDHSHRSFPQNGFPARR